jgi:hypothetical protein
MPIDIPHNYTPRKYQMGVIIAREDGYKRLCCIWHRRSGKDKTFINIMATEALQRVGSYFYFFPTYNQGRKILWDGMDRNGMPFQAHIPEEIRTATNHTEMKITLVNGSIIQVVGTDNVDSIVGTNPIGCVFSEYAVQDKVAWEYVRPILAENEGWAAFIFTPRGHNHGYDLYEMAKNNPAWFTEVLTVDDTEAIPPAVIDEERKAGMPEDLIRQEFYASFEASLPGAYFADEMRWIQDNGRIKELPDNKDILPSTCWDIGIDDSMSIWTFKNIAGEVHWLKYFEGSGKGLEYYVDQLRLKDDTYDTHYLPHDARGRSAQTGKSFEDYMKGLGIENVKVSPRPMIKEIAIEASRRLLKRSWFDINGCSKGIQGLREYRSAYDDERKVRGISPVHDWASHVADAYSTFALEVERLADERWTPDVSAVGF